MQKVLNAFNKIKIEVKKHLENVFYAADLDNDGHIEFYEVEYNFCL